MVTPVGLDAVARSIVLETDPEAIRHPFVGLLHTFFCQQPNEYEQCVLTEEYTFPGLEDVSRQINTAWTSLRGRQDPKQRLFVSTVPMGKVVATVGAWTWQTCLVAEYERGGVDMRRRYSSNQELYPCFAFMKDEIVHGGRVPHQHGHCLAIQISTGRELTTRLFQSDHPKLVPLHFYSRSVGGQKNKTPTYHIISFAAAAIDELERRKTGMGFFSEPGTDPFPSISELAEVTAGKSKDSSTLMHDCGWAFCNNVYHFSVGPKKENDVQEHCHHFLRHLQQPDIISTFRDSICALIHKGGIGEPCWTTPYDLESMDVRRVSLLEPPPGEED